jgi:hypothetical protein
MLHVPVTIDAQRTGQIVFESEAIRRLSDLEPGEINIHEKLSSGRSDVESFIEHIYGKTYHALIGKHYPYLLSVRDKDGRILAALGFRLAGQQPLFLERYMDVPVEGGVSAAFARTIARTQIVEIGNLASAGHGASIFLIAALMSHLDCQGLTHLVFTGTKYLRNYFRKLGLDPRDMGAADSARLPDGGASWGSYYATEPRIIAGDVHASYRLLRKVMLVDQVCESGHYHANLHPNG